MADIKDGVFPHDNMDAPQGDRVIPLFSLKGRTAIVSGAGAGIGLAVAQALAEAGANVAIWYNSNKQAVTEAENIATTYGVKCKSDYISYKTYDTYSHNFGRRQSIPSQRHIGRLGRQLHHRDCARV